MIVSATTIVVSVFVRMPMPVSAPSPLVAKLAQGSSTTQNLLKKSLIGRQSDVVQPSLVVPTLPAYDLSDDSKLDVFSDVLDGLADQNLRDNDTLPIAFQVDSPTQLPEKPLQTPIEGSSVSTDATNLIESTGLAGLAASQPIQTAGSSGRAPERSVSTAQTTELPGGMTAVEFEPQPEIPVEVEGFLERVENHAETLVQEIVIQGNDIALNQAAPPAQAVIMLPITEEDEQKAKGKNPTFGIAWLVTWSQKIIKKFMGKVVYRQEQTAVAQSTS